MGYRIMLGNEILPLYLDNREIEEDYVAGKLRKRSRIAYKTAVYEIIGYGWADGGGYVKCAEEPEAAVDIMEMLYLGDYGPPIDILR